jgi:hypothetical protein
MSKTRTLYVLTALLFIVAAVEPSTADSQASVSLGRDLPSLASAQDYRSASKSSLRLANEYKRQNEPTAACEELAKSLAYYRKALALDTGHSVQDALVNGDDGDGMQHIRSQFGCTRTH